MKRLFIILSCLSLLPSAQAQNAPGVLTVEKIMRDPKWIGTSPSNINWEAFSNRLYFSWNPDKKDNDETYHINMPSVVPVKATPQEKSAFVATGNAVFNNNNTAATWQKDGDVFFSNLKGKIIRVTQTDDREENPVFSFGDAKIVYTKNQNLYAWDIVSGSTQQITNFNPNPKQPDEKTGEQDAWLKKDQLELMTVLKERKLKREKAEAAAKLQLDNTPIEINIKDRQLGRQISISNDGIYVLYRLSRPVRPKVAIVPNYITETGYTEDISTRPKVGTQPVNEELFIYNRLKDTFFRVNYTQIPGIKDVPDFYKYYPATWTKLKKDSSLRALRIGNLVWQKTGSKALLDIFAADNKDRWICILDAASNTLNVVNRQHDDAWIAGPNIDRNPNAIGWVNDNLIWYQSEASGYSHLYLYDVAAARERQLTFGNFEVQKLQISKDRKHFYITTNEVHPGEKHLYKLDIATGQMVKLTSMAGANDAILSPDEKWIAIRHSYTTQPWELYVQENKAGAKPLQTTRLAKSDEFKTYQWRNPEVVEVPAADGKKIFARIYKPVDSLQAGKPAVLFVHGAGYLQNAHKWWSDYYREYMFNNMLADNGYVVMDIDYRGSAGYGADWRTGIYRHMGGKDLSDQVDAVKYMVDKLGVDGKRIGVYGGSYGGFITLMALFTRPDVFAAGAALRPVTDWANYNHGYTSDILNEPFTDSIAYKKSSPIYYANGLKGHLLICHGMLDLNVHYQDVVKLTQRLIELGKQNWELASYPMEDHGFVEPSSWTDEYRRIFKLFESVLKKPSN